MENSRRDHHTIQWTIFIRRKKWLLTWRKLCSYTNMIIPFLSCTDKKVFSWEAVWLSIAPKPPKWHCFAKHLRDPYWGVNISYWTKAEWIWQIPDERISYQPLGRMWYKILESGWLFFCISKKEYEFMPGSKQPISTWDSIKVQDNAI